MSDSGSKGLETTDTTIAGSPSEDAPLADPQIERTRVPTLLRRRCPDVILPSRHRGAEDRSQLDRHIRRNDEADDSLTAPAWTVTEDEYLPQSEIVIVVAVRRVSGYRR